MMKASLQLFDLFLASGAASAPATAAAEPPVVFSVLTAALVLTLFNVLPTALLLGCLSVLAGIILYNVFKNELPSAETSSFAWFAIGVFIFVTVDGFTVRSLIH